MSTREGYAWTCKVAAGRYCIYCSLIISHSAVDSYRILYNGEIWGALIRSGLSWGSLVGLFVFVWFVRVRPGGSLGLVWFVRVLPGGRYNIEYG